jgi:hypothetical protein
VNGQDAWKRSIRALLDEERRQAGAHPSPEELLDYHAGDLAPAARERVQDHLVLCESCSRTVLDLESFPQVEPAREEDRLSRFELEADWRRLRKAAVSRVPAPRTRLVDALAASLLLATVGLSLWVGRLRDEVRELSGPRADVYVADLVPSGQESRGEKEELVRVPAWAERVLLLLNLAGAGSGTEYRVEVLGPGARVLWSRSGLRRSPDGTFALEVPARLLPAGSYRVRLLDEAGKPVAEYGFRVGPHPRPLSRPHARTPGRGE